MRPIISAALLAAAAVVFSAFQAPAEAAPRKRSAAYQSERYIYYGREAYARERAPTRITVRRRSFLDPGSETKTFAQHYHDYALSPSYTVFPSYMDYSVTPGSWSRMPLPGLYDVPGWTRGP
jgi:hypothetical protein